MNSRELGAPSGRAAGRRAVTLGGAATRDSHSYWLRKTFAAVLTMFLVITGFVATTTVAHADTPGINIALLHNGVEIDDNYVVPEGEEILLRVQYNPSEPIDGLEIVFTLPDEITAPSTLEGNEAIESIVANGDGTYTVKFRDPIPDDVAEGAFALVLTAGPVDGDTTAPITWTIGDDSGGITVVVEDYVEPPEVIEDGYAKSVNPDNLDGFVLNSGSPAYTFTGLNPAIANEVLTYTLVLSSAEARTAYEIEDTLAAGLGFVPDSFAAELTTATGTETFTFTPTVTGNSFTGTVDVPEQSTLRITYEVQVTDVAALEALLQAQYDARNDTPGNYEILLPNDAVFGGVEERSVNVRLRGNIPGVGIGENFNKTGNWTLEDVITDDAGNLTPAAEMTYTLRANLTPWDGRNDNFTLQRNVVISDELWDQASWQSTDSDFITVSGAGPITSLTQATGFTGTAAEFADNAYVGQYALVGQTLLINVGQDNTTDLTIQVKAQLDTVAGLTGTESSTMVDGTNYPWNNRAQFYYSSGDPVNRDHDAGVVVLPDNYEEGVDDSAAFNKTAQNDEVQVSPGQQAEVPYRFSVNTAKGGIDPLNSRIIDEINTDVFDVTNLDETVAISGSYAGTPLTAEHFEVSLDEDDRLVIVLSDAGKTVVEGLPTDELWIVDIVLTTIPFDGKETFEIYNSAILEGEDQDWDYVSNDASEATSYGNEAELRKRIYNAETGEWTTEIDALIEDGEFVNNQFVYAIELIPRGSYGNDFPVTIFTREDVLPDSLEFLGFVELDGDNVPDVGTAHDGPDNLNGNIVATYADGVVTIAQESGTSLNPNEGRIVTYFAVEATLTDGVIVNTIAGSDTTINPYGDPSIDIEKWNDEGETPEYDDSGALTNDGYEGDFDSAPGKALAADTPLEINFTISNDGREDLVDVVVSDQLTDGAGVIEGLTCDFSPLGGPESGTEWAGPFLIGTQFDCTGTLPGLTNGDTHSNTAEVHATGITTREDVEDSDDWHGWVPTPSIDIEKWNDEDATPEYDDSGALTNDGYEGDFDAAPGKKLTANKDQQINFTVSNDGGEPLIDVVVTDTLVDGTGQIENLVCTFPDGSTGTEWAGPFEVGVQFDCTGTLPGLKHGESHANTAQVSGVGLYSGLGVEDADDWHGTVPEEELSVTGGQAPTFALLGGLLLLLAGGGALLYSRRNRTDA